MKNNGANPGANIPTLRVVRADDIEPEQSSVGSPLPPSVLNTHGGDNTANILWSLIQEHQGLLPQDPVLLSALWPTNRPRPSHAVLTQLLDHWVSMGQLRRVVIGSEAHIALAGSAPGLPVKPNHAPTTSTDSDKALFDLRVAVDIEHERALLYRVLAAISCVGTLLLLREAMLWWINF